MAKPQTITVDGPSGTGKSSVCKLLAEKMGYHYYNTGALYRSLTGYFLKKGWIDNSFLEKDEAPELLAKELKTLKFEMKEAGTADVRYVVGGEDMTEAATDQRLSLLVSKVSSWPIIREYLLGVVRPLGKKGRAIFDGRDMGSVVFPDADLKIFLTASSTVRAKRRYEELVARKPAYLPSLEEIKAQIEQRDAQDCQRAIAPLRKPEDSFLIDSSEMTLSEVVDRIIHLAKE